MNEFLSRLKKKKNRTLLGDIIYGKPIAQNQAALFSMKNNNVEF